MGRQLAAFKQEQAKFESEATSIQGETEAQLAERSKRKQDILANLESELTAMRKEIHRMELREVQLKKTQEQLLHQLDQVLSKRQMIQVRNEPKAREANEAHQKVVLQRQLTSLDVKLREAEGDDLDTEQRRLHNKPYTRLP
ncbi:hypothetical protein ACSSS7_002383 [Eimeria intestinalis]